jgi:hypothetical protein
MPVDKYGEKIVYFDGAVGPVLLRCAASLQSKLL